MSLSRTLSLLLSGFFLYCFLSQHTEIHGANKTKIHVLHAKDWRNGFSFKDYCFDNLGNTIFQFYWITCELVLFLGNLAVELLVYFDFHNKKR